MKEVRYLSESKRFPLLSEEGRKFLNSLLEHAHAPLYNYGCGDQLTADGLQRVRQYEDELRTTNASWRHGEIPDWMNTFVERCLSGVPFYRRWGGRAAVFFDLPTCSRKDLESEQWAFVPDSQPLSEMIIYYTSGTTGKSFHIPSHPEVSSKYLVTLRVALETIGVKLEGGKGRVSILNPCAQNSSLTYATLSSYLDEAGYVKVNLNPSEWKAAADPGIFIDDCEAEVFTGDPIAFIELMKVPLKKKPKALISSAMTLMPALKRKFTDHFECPVLDVYSMNETRFIAAGESPRHEVVPHDLYVEILDPQGAPCAPGVHGEITVTCPRNPYLPLVRYRTGDYAALDLSGARPALVGFSGRQPVCFFDSIGRVINNIDVAQALEPFPIGQYSLHQNADRSLVFRLRGGNADDRRLEAALRGLFGPQLPLTIRELRESETREGKVLPYSSDIELASFSDAPMAYSPPFP